MGIKWIEKNIDVYDVVNADEAFMTGTPFCILPVTSITGDKIGAGKMGVITERLIKTWSENVGVDIIAQIKGWSRASGSNAPTPYAFKK